jgi:enterochelin esterase-like enzyme
MEVPKKIRLHFFRFDRGFSGEQAHGFPFTPMAECPFFRLERQDGFKPLNQDIMNLKTPLKKPITLACGLLLATQLMAQSTDELPTVSSGKIERIANFETKLVSPRHVDVWLPEGYNPDHKYPVLYMHDGQMLFDATQTWNHQEWGVDETLSQLIDEGKIDPVILVGVWNGGDNRWPDYAPQKPVESISREGLEIVMKEYRQPMEIPIKVYSDNYLKFLVTELKPYIDSHYPTLPDKAHTFISGSSMGGLISMYAICEYPEVFGGAACISTHWVGGPTVKTNPFPDAFVAYLKENLPSKGDHKLYFDYGTETLDEHYEPLQMKVDAVMEAAGWTSEQWQTHKFEGADHSENSWKERFHIPIEFLMGK